MTVTEQKQAAYDHLASLGLLPDGYLEDCERTFDTGDIFAFGVPAKPQDAARALDGLSSRINLVVDEKAMLLNAPDDREIAFLEETSAMLMVSRIPSLLDWNIADARKGTFAILLGAVWHKRDGKVSRRIKQRERLKKVAPSNIAAYLLDAPLDTFELGKLPYAMALDKWLTNKVEWRLEKENRERSLDDAISSPDSEDEEITLGETFPDATAHDEIVAAADRKNMLDRLLNILSAAEKAAATKARAGEELTRTEQKALNRGKERIRKYCKEHDITDVV